MTPQAQLQILISLIQVAFFLGILYTRERQSRKDVNGIGIKARTIETKMERRNKQLIASLIEGAPDLATAKHYAKLLTDDSWPG